MMDSLQEGDITTEHRIVDFHSVHTVPRHLLDTLISEREAKTVKLLPPYREHLTIIRQILHKGWAAHSHNQSL